MSNGPFHKLPEIAKHLVKRGMFTIYTATVRGVPDQYVLRTSANVWFLMDSEGELLEDLTGQRCIVITSRYDWELTPKEYNKWVYVPELNNGSL